MTMPFSFYLSAWKYCQEHKITNYSIKRTGFREWTLTYEQHST